MFNFFDKIAIFTGVAGSLREAVSHSFWEVGANLVLVDRAAQNRDVILFLVSETAEDLQGAFVPVYGNS